MALGAELNIDGIKYDILECEYEFTQPIKDNGQPAGRPNGGLIHLVTFSQDDNNMFFQEWMTNKTDRKNGKITFTLKNKLTNKTVSFENAYCIRLYEYFNKHNDTEMFMKITISSSKITLGDKKQVVFKNDFSA